MFSRGRFHQPRDTYQSRQLGFGQTRQPDTILPPPSATQRKFESIEIEKIDFPREANVLPGIRNVKLVASFSWKDPEAAKTVSTILVPGQPPKWQPPSLPQTLEEDHGVYFRDINSARHSTFPTEPAMRAILHKNARDVLLEPDVYVCGNIFGCLMSAARNEERTFRFGVDRVGSTTFLVRKTNTPGETIDDVRGYGHTFPEAYTVWHPVVRGSTSHQRIIQYAFMGLKIMLRSECDGYLPDKLPPSEPDLHSTAVGTIPHEFDADNIVSPALRFNVDDKVLSKHSKKLEVVAAGQIIPQDAIFDLKTRSIKTKDKTMNHLNDFYSRLWANQTPNFVLAFHDRGTFDMANIQVKDVRDEIRSWETRNSDTLERLGGLLKKLIEVSTTEDTAKYEVRRTGRGPLEIWSESPSRSALPNDLRVELQGSGNGLEMNSRDDDEEVGEERGVTARRNSASEDEDEGDDADYLKF